VFHFQTVVLTPDRGPGGASCQVGRGSQRYVVQPSIGRAPTAS
jgi:hypothetical protein